MWIELHIGPTDPRPVTVNTDKLQDFQPITKNLDYQTHLWFSQDEGYVVEEGYNVVKSLVRGGFYVDTTGETLRVREEFFKS